MKKLPEIVAVKVECIEILRGVVSSKNSLDNEFMVSTRANDLYRIQIMSNLISHDSEISTGDGHIRYMQLFIKDIRDISIFQIFFENYQTLLNFLTLLCVTKKE